jgi:hypothetical protein
MRIDSSGNVGIGTSSPTSILNTYAATGSLSIQYVATNNNVGSGSAAIGFNVAFSGETTAACAKAGIGLVREAAFGGGSLCFYNNNSGAAGNFTTADEKMRIDSSGYLLVGYTSSNGAYKLQVNSQIFATSSTIATSDARYKQNVQPLNGALSIVKALRPVSFDWKKHPVHAFDTENTTVGFLAQEVQQVLADKPYLKSIIKKNECVIEPEVKDENGDVTTAAVTEEFLGIAEGNMIAILTSALQELSTKNDALEARLAALEAK